MPVRIAFRFIAICHAALHFDLGTKLWIPVHRLFDKWRSLWLALRWRLPQAMNRGWSISFDETGVRNIRMTRHISIMELINSGSTIILNIHPSIPSNSNGRYDVRSNKPQRIQSSMTIWWFMAGMINFFLIRHWMEWKHSVWLSYPSSLNVCFHFSSDGFPSFRCLWIPLNEC